MQSVSSVPIDALTNDQPNDKRDTDANLIKRCKEGDTQSFRQLYLRHQQRVRSTLYQLCGTSSLDDLVQEVFLRVWKGLPKLRETSQFSTWLYRISWNVASDQRRQFAQAHSQRQTLTNSLPVEQSAPDLMHLHYQDIVQRGLNELSFDHRAVLVLHDLEDVPQKEVATILSIPVGTVKSRLFHARTLMRQFFQQQGVQL
ncbi:sigma-70 family RNA polymerase sigma factor [Trichocoleus sp. FACHB-90]|uniref:sigma-70 family RNA polymerase sigma factor n=1 Tax=Cyanophyceae TaxID=3028117 RepID=UPI001689F341|nr:sigma-70 family RNA polymerase sigma factor [Trichocoleus sp. FACHB-90]MBD1929889.1 sigma-70 family RNA polymerase sigma factor [Trichocoleus sp. FACHB-90]